MSKQAIIDQLIKEINNNYISIDIDTDKFVILSNINKNRIDYKNTAKTLQILNILYLFYGIELTYYIMKYKSLFIYNLYNEMQKDYNKDKFLCKFLYCINKIFKLK